MIDDESPGFPGCTINPRFPIRRRDSACGRPIIRRYAGGA